MSVVFYNKKREKEKKPCMHMILKHQRADSPIPIYLSSLCKIAFVA